MLFVANRIPPELRKVVEFMNVQMRPAEVLAVELRQYQGGGLRTLAPIVLGQTQEAIEQKSDAGAKLRRLWDEPRVLEALSAACAAAVAATATALIAWMRAKADRVVFNDAPSYGCIAAEFNVGSQACSPVRVWTDGGVPVSFSQLKRTPAFAAPAARRELMDRLNAIPGVAIQPDAIEKQSTIRPAALSADQEASFRKIMDRVAEKLRAAPAEKGE
jgi:hypothetical protein